MTEEQSQIAADTILRRSDAAAALSSAGYPISASTLATMASRGGGPAYRLFGTKVLYRWGDLIEWAQNRTSARECETARDAAA